MNRFEMLAIVSVSFVACGTERRAAPLMAEAQPAPTGIPSSGVPTEESDETTLPEEIQPMLSVSPPSGDPTEEYDETRMLENIHGIVLQAYQRFVQDAEILDRYVAKYCGSIGTDEENPARRKAQEAFLAAMHTWSAAEMMTMGPAVRRGDGEGLRDHIYSWRIGKAPCAVDHKVVEYHSGLSSSSREPLEIHTKGMDALEYLLFQSTLEPACGSIYAVEHAPPPKWSDLSEVDRRRARCGYSSRVAEQIVDDAAAILGRWREYESEFLHGAFDQGVRRAVDGREQIYHALLFYIRDVMGSMKLRLPFGFPVMDVWPEGWYASLCGKGTACAEDVEAPFSRKSIELMLANLVGFDMLFYGIGPDGKQGQGFRNLLSAAAGMSNPPEGDPLTGPQLQAAIRATAVRARGELESVPGSLFDAVNAGHDGKGLLDLFDELSFLLWAHIGTSRDYHGGLTDMLLPIQVSGHLPYW